jgi:hypothetical protein
MNRIPLVIALAVVLTAGAYMVCRKAGPQRPPVGAAEQAGGPAGEAAAPSAGPVVFTLSYRGLDAPDDPLSYRSFWGFGRADEPDDPFVRAVRSRVKKCTLVYNGALPSAQWSVVELQDNKPVAFYFDADADGKLAESERFLPAQPAGPHFGYPYAFVTSDFLMRTEDEREIPFRIMLVGYAYGNDEVSWMWSPCCILEGQAPLAGMPMKLFLYADGFSGSFTTFSSSSYALLPAGVKLPEYAPHDPLSSLIRHEGTFYRVRLDGTHEKDKTVRVTFERDTTPTGRMTAAFRGGQTLKTRFTSASIVGGTDSSIRFSVDSAASTYPVGQYQLASACVRYGAQSDDEWQVNFTEGPAFTVDACRTSRVELGGLTLSITAVNEQDRYRRDAQEQTTFARGTAIYLTPQIKGKAGEAYLRFAQKAAGANNMTDVKPHLTIADPDGRQVVSADLEYG